MTSYSTIRWREHFERDHQEYNRKRRIRQNAARAKKREAATGLPERDDPMSRTRKYIAGPRMGGIDELVRAINSDRYVMHRGKPQHPGWISSMQLGYLLSEIRRGFFTRAQINPEWVEKQEEPQP